MPGAGSGPGGRRSWIAGIPSSRDATSVLRRNSRTFGWATALFSGRDRSRVARLYAFCRVTDDIVDGGTSPSSARARLATWRELSREAYDGRATGVELLDEVMDDAYQSGAPFRCVEHLLDGMAFDLNRVRIPDLDALWLYGYRVAGVIGEWMLHLFDIPGDAARAARAHDLGRALQLTNILRDVGEDLARDRIYLPADLLAEYDLDERALRSLADGTQPMPEPYRALIERLMGLADARYGSAAAAFHEVPPAFARPVRVAAALYHGIHAEIRGNDYDNLRRRAVTSGFRKVRLAAGALLE